MRDEEHTLEELEVATRLARLVDGEDRASPGDGTASEEDTELEEMAALLSAVAPGTEDDQGLAEVRRRLDGPRLEVLPAPRMGWFPRLLAGAAAAALLTTGWGILREQPTEPTWPDLPRLSSSRTHSWRRHGIRRRPWRKRRPLAGFLQLARLPKKRRAGFPAFPNSGIGSHYFRDLTDQLLEEHLTVARIRRSTLNQRRKPWQMR